MSAEEICYFAFGANMSTGVVARRRGVKIRAAEAARLPAHALVFEDPGFPWIEPAFASIREDSNAEVWGVLYRLELQEFALLDRFEGPNYRLAPVIVETPDAARVEALAYMARRKVAGRRPSRRYLDLLIKGAGEHGLPEAYIQGLRDHPAAWSPPGLARAMSFAVSLAEAQLGRTEGLLERRRARRRGFPGGK